MKYPYVTAMIVVRNEQDYIANCLKSLIYQDYPKNQYELLIIDGESTDNTLTIIENIINEYEKESNSKLNFKILSNKKKILASGWNIGIRNAAGNYVIRIDAHAKAYENFISKSVETALEHPDAVCVGGKLQTKAISKRGNTVSKILSSPFGIGNSKFRYSEKSQYVDTVAFGLYKKEIFDKVGYFDETLARNQDNNMHARIKAVGGKFYFNPEIQCIYYSRDSYLKMCKQGYQNGKWNIIGLKKDKHSVSLRHLIPLMFLLSLLFLGIGAFFNKVLFILLCIECILYFSCDIIACFTKSKNLIEVLSMFFLFPMLHISYGLGSLFSILRGGK